MAKELKIFAAFAAVFLFAYFLPLATPQFADRCEPAECQGHQGDHRSLCVAPVVRPKPHAGLRRPGPVHCWRNHHIPVEGIRAEALGPKANKVEAYSVASVSGTVLAVCSCSVLPMFAGIYRVGAGLGPAACFLYAGPAINILAIFLTARVLGFELGVARVIGAMVFGVIVGLLMAVIFRGERGKTHCGDDGHARSAAGQAAAVAERRHADRHDRLSGLQRLVQSGRQGRRAWRTARSSRRRCNTKRSASTTCV